MPDSMSITKIANGFISLELACKQVVAKSEEGSALFTFSNLL